MTSESTSELRTALQNSKSELPKEIVQSLENNATEIELRALLKKYKTKSEKVKTLFAQFDVKSKKPKTHKVKTSNATPMKSTKLDTTALLRKILKSLKKQPSS